jgi:hypothetical protein
VIRWLQTSLFGQASGKKAVPSPKIPAASKVPVDPEDAAFQSRWVGSVQCHDITLELAPRLRQGWKLSWRRGGGGVLRAPRAFRDAPDDILKTLGAWARLTMQRKSPARKKELRALEKSLHAWIEARHDADGHARKLRQGRAARRLERLEPKGRHHDLDALLAVVIAEYFPGHPVLEKARITWSRRWGGLSTQTTAHDAQGIPYPLLSISRGYDHLSATAEIVGGVVHHECLHVVVPPQEGNGRRIVHGREFRRREKEYRFHDAWREWHAKKLPGIIRRGQTGNAE